MSAPTEVMPAQVVPHAWHEDVLALLIGSLLASLGLYVLESGGAVTGGTPGLGLVLSHATSWPFAAVYVVVNIPFVLLGIVQRGWRFTVRSAIAVGLLAGFSLVHPHLMPLEDVSLVYGAIIGNVLVGVAIVVLFRHGSSLGGFGVLALLCQDKLGWRAGYVQLACDAVVLLLSIAVVPPVTLLVSAAGAVLLNFVLALNHRPGRYFGA